MKNVKTIEFFDRVVSLSGLTIGRVVAQCDLSDKADKTKYSFYHLVGFSRNPQNELILALQRYDTDDLATAFVVLVHPGNCCIEDY